MANTFKPFFTWQAREWQNEIAAIGEMLGSF